MYDPTDDYDAMSHSTSLSHPVFVPNQVLTDTQLNHMREYLDSQILMTRTHVAGTGIVCGLQVAYKTSEPHCDPEDEFHAIYVSAGYGITSEGYILELNSETRYTRYRRFESDGYDLWDGAPTTHPIFELGEHNADEDEFSELTEVQLHKRVVVLYLDRVVEDLKSCAVTDCSNKGSHVHFTLHALLVPESILQGEEACEGLVDERLYLPRFYTGLETDSQDENCILAAIQNTDDILGAYGKLASAFAKDLRDRLIAKLRVMRTLKQPPESTNGLKYDTPDFLDIGDESDIIYRLYNEAYSPDVIFCEGQVADDYNQYHYAFVRDLGCAYAEFLECWCELVKCCETPGGFPRHLMLDHVPDRLDEDGKAYRHTFRPAPLKNVMHESWTQCRKLFLRILAMIETFDINNMASLGALSRMPEILVTPSQTPVFSLGEQAIPFYYDVSADGEHADKLIACWQPTDCCTVDPVYAYYFQVDDVARDVQKRPLYHDISKCTFYRIEGHIGKKPADAVESIHDIRRRHNLDFDILVLYLDETAQLIDGFPEYYCFTRLYWDFVDKICGMEHLGGVKKGGTLILIADPRCPGFDDDVIVADFSLPWRVSCCLTADEVQEEPPYPGGEAETATILVEVLDQDGFYVDGAGVKLFDGEITMMVIAGSDEVRCDSTGLTEVSSKTTPIASELRPGGPAPGRVVFEGLRVGRAFGLLGSKDVSSDMVLEGCKNEIRATLSDDVVTLVLNKHDKDTGQSPPSEPNEPAEAAVFAGRQKEYGNALTALNSTGDFQRNRTYQATYDFISGSFDSLNDMRTAYREVLGRLRTQCQRSRGDRLMGYQLMLRQSAWNYLDRLVEGATPGARLSNSEMEPVLEKIDIIREIDAQLVSEIGSGWDAANLKNEVASKRSVIEQIEALLG